MIQKRIAASSQVLGVATDEANADDASDADDDGAGAKKHKRRWQLVRLAEDT